MHISIHQKDKALELLNTLPSAHSRLQPYSQNWLYGGIVVTLWVTLKKKFQLTSMSGQNYS